MKLSVLKIWLSELFGDAKTQMSEAATALRNLEREAKRIEDDVTAAQRDVDTSAGTGGAGDGYADSDAIGTKIGTPANAETGASATGLEAVLANALALEGAVSTADNNLKGFLNTLNSDASLSLSGGAKYTGSTSIGSEIAALETLLNGSDADNAADRVTDFFDIHNGSDERKIDDLADLNGQIANSIVARDIDVTDATPQTVKLTTAEVDRLGEGAVQIKATQTDGVGNLHEGGPAAGSFVIDTIDPGVVSITDDQSGIAFDDANTVAYTLTFSEAVQAIDANDLTVTGATIDSVAHTAGSKTATVTVTVTDDSTANVSITAKPSITDIAGNPLVQAADTNQTVDTKNPTASYASAIKNQNTNGAADVASDADCCCLHGDLLLSQLRPFKRQTLMLLAAHWLTRLLL